jgi:hypothetical protein
MLVHYMYWILSIVSQQVVNNLIFKVAIHSCED